MAPKVSSENVSPFQNHRFDLIRSKGKLQNKKSTITMSLFRMKSRGKSPYAKPIGTTHNVRSDTFVSKKTAEKKIRDKCDKLAILILS